MAFATVAIIGASVAGAGGLAKLGMSLAGRQKRIEEQENAKEEMQARMEEYENLDTSNIYADVENQYKDMENTYEDMTINQQQAQFEAQQGAQQRADIMQNLRGAAGGSGIAALAQTLASQGSLDAQKASASIASQESANQMAAAKEAGNIQGKEREGELMSRQMENDKLQSQMGMTADEIANQRDRQEKSKEQMYEGAQEAGTTAMSMGGGGGMPTGGV